MPEISVIVPVYKVEPYIHKCVDSILAQAFSDYELILVDDGSPDTCGNICDEYAKKDARIRVIHKENGGLSDARNAGMKIACGGYVIFIDSDDHIDADMLSYLYENLTKADADMATCGIYEVYADRIEKQEEELEFVCSGEEAFRCILQGHTIRGEIWNKLIKRSCISDLEFPKGKLYEDIFYTVDMMQRIKKVAVGTKPKYYYLHRSDSITGKAYRPKLFDIIDGYTKNYQVLAVVYPFFISGQLEQSMVRTMVLVLASSTLVDFFFLGKYRVLLTANQRGYVVAVIQSVGTVVNMTVSILLIYLGASVLIVKAVATGVYILRLLLVRIYVKKEYPNVDFHAEPKMDALNQRGAALLHQIVGIIVNNTDVVLLTILIGSGSLLEVSVYSAYNLVVTAVNTLLTSFSNGLTAGFGEVISKGEEDVLRENYSSYEYMYLVILFIVVVCMGVLIIPFIAVYTMNMTDVDYVRPLIGVLFTVIVLLQNIRIPGITIICAAGHYKETRYQAIIEAVINLVVSIALIQKLGMAGVLIGTVCSYGYRSLDVILYNSKYLVKGTGKRTFSRIGRNIFVIVVLVAVGIYVVPQNMTSFVSWFLYAVLSGAVSSCGLLGLNYFAEPEECRKLLVKFKMVVK